MGSAIAYGKLDGRLPDDDRSDLSCCHAYSDDAHSDHTRADQDDHRRQEDVDEEEVQKGDQEEERMLLRSEIVLCFWHLLRTVRTWRPAHKWQSLVQGIKCREAE